MNSDAQSLSRARGETASGRSLRQVYTRAVGLFLGIFTALFFIALLLPLYGAEQGRRRAELEHQAALWMTRFDFAVREKLTQVASLGSRTQIRQALVGYERGRISIEALRDFSQKRYEDGLAVFEDVLYAGRYTREGFLVARLGSDSPDLAFKPIGAEESVVLLRQSEGRRVLEVRLPILEKGELIGQDVLLYSMDIRFQREGDLSFYIGEPRTASLGSDILLPLRSAYPGIELVGVYAPSSLRPPLWDFVRPFLPFALLSLAILGIAAYLTIYRASRRLLDSLELLAERRALLVREANHRIKNNLSIIMSLIDLSGLRRPSISALEELKAKIGLIARLHERLYREPEAERVDARAYMEEIVATVLSAQAESRAFPYRVEGQAPKIPEESCAALGFIISELILNAIKYALGPGDGILILLGEEKEAWMLVFENEGRPFPAEVDPLSSPSFGMELIRGYAKQLGGSLSFERSPRTSFRFRFPRR